MTKRLIALTLALLLGHAGAAAASAKTKAEKDVEMAGKVRQAVLSLGTGEQARVKVRLRDGSKLEGYVVGAGDAAFTVVSAKTGAARVVPYPQVGQVKGNNLSTGAKIAIVAGVAAAVIAMLWVAADKDFSN